MSDTFEENIMQDFTTDGAGRWRAQIEGKVAEQSSAVVRREGSGGSAPRGEP
jgi:hypothetical protein